MLDQLVFSSKVIRALIIGANILGVDISRIFDERITTKSDTDTVVSV